MFQGIFPSALFTNHQGQSGGRGLSPRLWAQVAAQCMAPDGFSIGRFEGDDFNHFGLCAAVASNVGRYAGRGGTYLSYEDTGATIAQLATEKDGVMSIAVDADDNQEAWIQPGGAASVMACISDTAGSDKLLVFESRFRTSQVTAGNLFIGLSEEGLAAADTIDDSGDTASKDFIGFAVNEDDPDALSFIYRKAGAAVQTPIAIAKALAANTWYKVGFVYDPAAPASKRISVFVDNEENATHITATNIAASTFPDGEELNPLFGCKNVTDIMVVDVDWWALFQAS